MAVVGSYTVTYDVTDSEGNAAVQVTRTVNVVDTTIPVITLTGADPQTLEVMTAYSELGATASDNYDGDITGSIVIDSSAVNMVVVGSYTVTYNVTDSEGNAAVQVTRTVNVVDTTLPFITLIGANPQTVQVGSAYGELGATASDNYDGDISPSVVIDATAVDNLTVGSYLVTYDVTDSEGNAAVQVTRTVNVVDTTLPVITLTGANPQVIEVGSAYVELGATASDNYDGDISGSIVIDSAAVNTAVVGSYSVTYNVTDSEGNAAVQVTRTVNVVDTALPVITLTGVNPQVIEVGSPYAELGATATDNYDGDLTGSIVIDTAAVDTSIVGSYLVTYNVTDANGNAATQVTRTVNVVDTTVPVIALTGANPQTIEVDSPYVELGATATDNYDGDLTGSIVTNSAAVNTAVVGSYIVTYDVVDSSGNPAAAIRTVNVVDTTAPVITLVGANPQVLEVGSPYVELGATATDNYDGVLTGSIVTDSSAVNTAVVGSYAVTYNVTDANGNAAAQVTRTVDVVDTTAPVITLTGPNPQTIEVGSPYVELGAAALDNYDGDISGSISIDASAVVTTVVGSYVVTYDVTDSEGNAAIQVTRTVDVVDTTAPVITLVGANPQVIEAGSPYVELGATAFDVGDGDVTGWIVTDSSAVNTSAVGSYTVTYDVTDSEGNVATQVTRTVDVVDTTAPVITLIGANPQVLEVLTGYVELGATATDIGDGDISGSIVIDTSGVDMATVGSYVVTYDVTDSQGNPALQVTRTVQVVDTTLPVITLTGPNPQVIEAGSPYVELGATASDNYDGDISGAIVIDATAVNTAVVGSYLVTYNVTDSEGNAATQVTRTVNVVDTTAPVITLTGPNPQVIEVGSPYSELGATALDVGDGDVTGSIVIDASAVNTAVVASYSVTYDVTDSQGNAATQVTRTVQVVDTTLPVITLLGVNPQVIEAGAPYVELGATATDNYDGNVSGSIVIDATAVNTAVVGSYPVTYNVTDANGNAAIQVTRTVNVVDTTAPVITLLGANPQVIEVHSPYAESGATASDVGDGDLTGSIVIDASAVNTAVVGSYGVTYDVTDSQGNPALQVTRTVQVVDTTLPVITLTGPNPQVIEAGSPYVELGATASDNYDGDISGSIAINAAAVNTAAVGSYSVTYDVTDANGNAATQAIRTVNVIDTTAPVITLVGVNPQIIEVHSPYVELGATATDIGDGDLTGSIVIDEATVDTAIVGSYVVTYDVTDSQGNAAIQVTRTVDVVDTTLPVLTLTGANPQIIEVGSPYVELGATATDNYDGDISGSIAIDAAAVNTAVVGSYVVTYDVTDANGNAATPVTRPVNVVDTTLPVITLLGANPLVIEVGTVYGELGATASDNYDGDLSGSIAIDASAVNTAVLGSYPVTYNVTDTNGNAAVQVIRTVDVVDTTVPVITLTGPNPQVIEVDSPYVEQGATASDNYDGDISGSIVINSGAVNTAVVGSYVVTYDVTDANGNAAAQVTRIVNVVDTTIPVIALVGANPQPIDVGSPYVELGATASDNYDGDITGSIIIDASAVNNALVGSYAVTYNVTDSNGNAAAQVTRTVNVVNVAPTLGLIGNQTLAEGTLAAFTATASDPDPTDPLLFSLSGAPAGAAIDAVTGVFTWTPTEAQGPNSFAFDVVVSDGGVPSLSDSQTVTITVTEVNLAPSLGPIAPQFVDELANLSFNVPAGDPDIPGNSLTFILSGAPAGATVDPVTGVFSWTPTEAQGPGVYVFDVSVSDDGTPSLGDTLVMTVTVAEVNVAPLVANPGNQSSAENDIISLFIGASDTDTPANTLTYSATGLPDGLAINATTGEITGTVGYDANAASPFATTVTATDNGTPIRSGQTTFAWTVADTNRPPLAGPDIVSVAEDTAQVLDVLVNDTDPDADPLSVASIGAAGHGSTSSSGGGITYSPDLNYFGPDSFVYTVSDGRGGFDSTTVNVNVTPVNDAPALNVLSSLNVDEQTPAVFVASATDIEGDNVAFSLGGAPAGASIDPVSGAFTWTPAEDQGPASYTFDVIATDDGSPVMATSRQVLVNVAEVNVAPVFVNPGNQFSAENETVSLAVVASDADIPAGSMTFSATNLPPGLSINPATGEIAGVLPFDASEASPYAVTLSATDDGTPQRSGQVTFSWFVGNTNRAPTALNISVFAEAGVPAPLVLNGSDPDGDLLTFQIASGPAQGALTGGPRLYDYTPLVTAGGTDTFTFTVSDGDLQDTGIVTVSITPNLAPSGGPDEYVVRRGGILVVDAPGVLGNDRDPEGRPITAIVDSQPAHGSLTLQTDGSFTYNNRGEDVDLDLFTYRIDDGMRISEPIRVLLIVEENLAPVVQNDAVTLDEDDTLVFHPLENDHDPNGEPLLVSDVVPPEHGSVDWSLDGAFIYRPARDWNGTDTFTYQVTDGDLTGTGTITLQVVPVNDDPVALPAAVTGSSGEILTVDLRPYATDVDGDPLEFILEAPPAGTAERIEPGVFAIDLDGVIKDLPPLTFIVSDPDNATATSLLAIAIEIPAELVGVPSLVSDDIDRGPAPGTSEEPSGDPPGSPALVTGLRLMVGSVLDTFQALRMPVFVLLLFVIASLFLGLSRKFAFSSTATVLPLSGRKKVDIVMAQSQAGVPAREEPGIHQGVAHRFRPDEVGILTTGARMMVRSEVWVEVETPDGDAWVDANFLTEQQSRAVFVDDLRVRELVSDFVDELYSGGDLLEVTGGHDLHVALYGPPVRFAASSLRRLLSGASVYWWWGPDGDTPRHQGTFAETVGDVVAAAYRNRDAHQLEPSVPIPIEFANMHSLVVGNHELGEGWRIFFRYQDDEPSIAGLMREVAPNPASMHGLVGV
jgi:PKD repeat protein